MITDDHPLIELLALMDLVWVETALGTPKVYSEQAMFKAYLVSRLSPLTMPAQWKKIMDAWKSASAGR